MFDFFWDYRQYFISISSLLLSIINYFYFDKKFRVKEYPFLLVELKSSKLELELKNITNSNAMEIQLEV
jgi:hypothetical protein